MSRLRFVLPAAAALALAAFISSPVFAFAQSQGGSQVNVPNSTNPNNKTTNLTPIVVHGHRLPFPIELQMFKKALTRSWSSSWDDRHKLVCSWNTPTGTHLQYLRCQTNLEH